jgi:hypothetical protein
LSAIRLRAPASAPTTLVPTLYTWGYLSGPQGALTARVRRDEHSRCPLGLPIRSNRASLPSTSPASPLGFRLHGDRRTRSLWESIPSATGGRFERGGVGLGESKPGRCPRHSSGACPCDLNRITSCPAARPRGRKDHQRGWSSLCAATGVPLEQAASDQLVVRAVVSVLRLRHEPVVLGRDLLLVSQVGVELLRSTRLLIRPSSSRSRADSSWSSEVPTGRRPPRSQAGLGTTPERPAVGQSAGQTVSHTAVLSG